MAGGWAQMSLICTGFFFHFGGRKWFRPGEGPLRETCSLYPASEFCRVHCDGKGRQARAHSGDRAGPCVKGLSPPMTGIQPPEPPYFIKRDPSPHLASSNKRTEEGSSDKHLPWNLSISHSIFHGPKVNGFRVPNSQRLGFHSWCLGDTELQ